MLLVLEKCLMKLIFYACSWAVASNGYMSPSCAHAGGQESSSLHKRPAYSKLSQNVLVVPVLAVIPPLCAINPSPPLTPLGSCIPFPWTRQVIQRFHWEKCSPMVKLFQATNGVKHCQQRLLWYCLFTPNLFFPSHLAIFSVTVWQSGGASRMSHCWHHVNDSFAMWRFLAGFMKQSQAFVGLTVLLPSKCNGVSAAW